MTEQRPTREFGRRKPAALPPPEPQKRSGHVALLVMGTLAVGTGAYALMAKNNCEPSSPAMAAPVLPRDNTACTSRGSSSGSGGGSGHWSRYSYFSGDSSSKSSSATSSDSASGHVTRGGFGAFAHAFGFSGHG